MKERTKLTSKQKAIGRLLTLIENEGGNEAILEYRGGGPIKDIDDKKFTKVAQDYMVAVRAFNKYLSKFEKEINIWDYDWDDFEIEEKE